MKRIDKIFDYLEKQTKTFSKEDLLNRQGITASDIADRLKILRNNVSKELNELFRSDKIIKIKGRPVKFLHKEAAEHSLQTQFKEKFIEVSQLEEALFQKENEDPFDALIGSKKSLRNQVEQGKAAILYPPSGLHTLIVGQTGVGKTLFAKMMHTYGKHINRFSEDSPFVVFNCADYYNNPQLLLSHVFGHVKGAFTGATHEKEGLVEKANGGVLFMDEIHRLPPEGQEMIFYFIDTQTYNKLGESERKRKANVLIIGATTEDPSSSMLKTFIRRIPITINIPHLQERSNEEKICIIKYLFSNEAHRVNKPIKIAKDVVKALIGSVSYGNIGQLKSNIQLACAKGFLNSINEKSEYIKLDFKILPDNIRDGLFEIGKNRKELEELGAAINSHLVIMPEGYKGIAEEDSFDPPFNLYKLIEDKMGILKEEGMDDHYINKFITTDVNIHIKSFYNRFYKNKESRDRILKIVDKDILEFAEEMKEMAEKELKRKYSDRFVYALSLHLSAFFKRITDKKYAQNRIYDSIEEQDEEFKLALKIKEVLEERFEVSVPEGEITYFAILLKSVEEERQGNVGIIVAAHGNSTASSMVDVAERLLGKSNICAVDMPLDVSPREILEVVIDKVKSLDSGKGVLLLVDMGSLLNFESTIIERTGIKVKTIDMVSTALTLEAVRKANIFDMGLEEIYHSLREFRGYNPHESKNPDSVSNKVIVTVCTSGKGTAIKLKEIVEKIVFDLTQETIRVVPTGVRELEETIKELQHKYNVLVVVGVKKPSGNIPFIPLEKLIDTSGEQMLRDLLLRNNLNVIHQEQGVVVKDLCEDNLKEFLTYLNPQKISGIMIKFVKELERELDTAFDNTMKIKIVIHTAYALERMVINDGLIYREDKNCISEKHWKAVDTASKYLKEAINLTLSDDEKYYICDMLV